MFARVMKNGVLYFCLFCLILLSCEKQKVGSSVTTETASDSVSLNKEGASNAVVEELDMPVAADELFDDFFFNFASNQTKQKERVVFPLPVEDGNKNRVIQRKQWKLEPFFMNQDYYTLFFDSPAQMELVRDTTVSEVIVERFYFEKQRVEQFMFSRESGRWMLHKIIWQPMAHNANAQFMKFYHQFATDSIFQHKSLAEQIQFSGPDPDDDFSTIDGVITPDFWEAFRPEIPRERIYNIVYGSQNPTTTQKIMLLRGIANGLEVEITFRLQKGRWKLTKLLT